MLRHVLAVTALTIMPLSALAGVNLEARATGQQAQVSLVIVNDFSGDYLGIVITRYQMGTCEAPVDVTAAPIPIPAAGSGAQTVDLIVPLPLERVFYLFEARLLATDGNLVPIADGWSGQLPVVAHDLVATESAVVIRGPLSLQGGAHFAVNISPCANGCWGDQTESFRLSNNADQQLLLYALAGLVVDVYGTYYEPDGMAGPGVDIISESVQLAPGGTCGVVAATPCAWGALKAQYR